MNPLIQIKRTRPTFLIGLALTCFVLLPVAKAQDGDELRGNTAEGSGALHTYIATANSSFNDTAIGNDALFSNTTGGNNTAIGVLALEANTTGIENTATGAGALRLNTTSSDNTANGFEALFNNTGQANTATGAFALQSNTVGPDNTATGDEALRLNTNGASNTATGAGALFNNTSGNENTATGAGTLLENTTGSSNTANGVDALLSNTTGGGNTATGHSALGANTTGNNNTANGVDALFNNTTGKSNIALGFNAGSKFTTGNNNIDIGNVGVAGEANKIRIGAVGTQTATFIAGIHGVTVASAIGVVVDVNGHLGTITSSARFKEAIKPMDKASEAILALKPVTFRYKHELDPDGIPQFGLVAEQVEKINPDLVARDADGKVNTVRYEAVNAMLLNEFLKEHRRVEEQGATIAQMKKQIEALTATVQKVSDQLELSKAAPQLVANP
jgi:hypothetical protein